MRSYLVSVLIFSLLMSSAVIPANTYARSNICAILFQKVSDVRKNHIMPFLQEAVRTRGLSLFFKKDGQTPSKTYFFGFFRDTDPENTLLERVVQFPFHLVSKPLAKKKIDFTPFQAIDEAAFGKPIRWISQKISGTAYRRTGLVAFFSTGLLMGWFFHQSDQAYEKALFRHTIEVKKDHFDSLIRYDYRFHSLYTREYPYPVKVYEAAELEEEIYENYYSFMNTERANDSLIINHPLFSRLKPILEEGVNEIEGFEISKKGRLSDEQKKQIIRIQNKLTYEYEVLAAYALNSRSPIGQFNLDEIRANVNMQEFLKKLERDPYTVKLHQLVKDGIIERGEISLYLQEDAFWQAQFEIYEVLKIKKLMKKSETEYYPSIYVTNHDIREETLRDIRTKAN